MKKNKMNLAWSRLSLAAPLLVSIIGACGGTTQGSPQVGSESHFLGYCSSSCGDGLECIGEICTRPCLTSASNCSDLALSAACTNQSVEPGQVAVCDLVCNVAGDCKALGAGYTCSSGFCRGPASNGGAGGSGSAGGSGGSGGTGTACSDYLDQSPPPVVHTVTILNSSTRTLYIPGDGGCGNEHSLLSVENAGQPVDIRGRRCMPICSDVMQDGPRPMGGAPQRDWENDPSAYCLIECEQIAVRTLLPGETLTETARLAYAPQRMPKACADGIVSAAISCDSRVIPPMGSHPSVTAFVDPNCTNVNNGCEYQVASASGNYFFEDQTITLSSPDN